MTLPDLPKTNLLFVGEVMSLGPEPAHWSGRTPAFQSVKYRIVDMLKGKLEGPQAEVSHLVVKNSPIARSDRAGLSPDYFHPGRKFLVGVQLRDERMISNYLVLWDQSSERAIREALGLQPK